MIKHNSIRTDIQSENLLPYDNDEISLSDIFIILIRHKNIVIATMITVLLIAIIYLWQAKPLYEGSFTVEVGRAGQMDEAAPLENLKVLHKRLQIEYPFIAKVDRENIFFIITVRDYVRETVKEKLKMVSDQLLHKHNMTYNMEMNAMQKQDDLIRINITELRSQIDSMSSFIKEIKTNEPTQASILVIEKNGLIENLLALEEKSINFNLNISKLKASATKLIHETAITDNPVKPKVVVIIMLSLITGIFISIFAVFIVEFFAKVSQKMART